MHRVGACPTWVLSNHDVIRPVSRFADPPDGAGLAVGLRRARAALLLLLSLPGSVYLYQGEELGLPEVFQLPAQSRQDPIFAGSGGASLGRDGCRVPLPWSGRHPPFGFSPPGVSTWLPQPTAWADLSVAAQQDDPNSTLQLYRRALDLRRKLLATQSSQHLRWHSAASSELLVYQRGEADQALICVLNQGRQPASIAALPMRLDGDPILSSQVLPVDGTIPPDTAAWWRCVPDNGMVSYL
jgi:alpha-glucosidase